MSSYGLAIQQRERENLCNAANERAPPLLGRRPSGNSTRGGPLLWPLGAESTRSCDYLLSFPLPLRRKPVAFFLSPGDLRESWVLRQVASRVALSTSAQRGRGGTHVQLVRRDNVHVLDRTVGGHPNQLHDTHLRLPGERRFGRRVEVKEKCDVIRFGVGAWPLSSPKPYNVNWFRMVQLRVKGSGFLASIAVDFLICFKKLSKLFAALRVERFTLRTRG